MMETELHTLIKNAAAIESVNWGNEVTGKPYPQVAINLIGEEGQHTMQGRETFRLAGIQVDVWAKTMIEAVTIRKRILAELDGFMSDDVVTNILLRSLRSEKDTSESDNVLYRQSIDLDVWYHE